MPEIANSTPTAETPSFTADEHAANLRPSGVSVTQPQTENNQKPVTWRDITSCFLSTFVTIFLAELGDKTQVATLLMSAQSHKPMTVFLGAATALVATSLVGVLLGRWLSKILSPQLLERVTGIILAIVSILLFIDVAGA